jgi:hypothetical protein
LVFDEWLNQVTLSPFTTLLQTVLNPRGFQEGSSTTPIDLEDVLCGRPAKVQQGAALSHLTFKTSLLLSLQFLSSFVLDRSLSMQKMA